MAMNERVIVITGATGNLGRTAARAFTEQGAHLVLNGTDATRLRTLASELDLSEERVLLYAANLRDPASAPALAQAALNKFARVDILLHLVGGWSGGKTVPEWSAPTINEMLQQHLWTTFYLAQAFVPMLTANRWGRIIVVSSPVATRPTEKSAPYAIAKAAQETLMLTVAQEVKGTGVTANVLQVRAIDAKREPGKLTGTTPAEITATILYLCSKPAGVVNGARIPLYGSP
jgi:NAD(P)-dependent dehydrogenase (short-subunit alcohol dehydrogenase family)